MLDLDYKEVAERYGGNKQKIAQAAAIGALGPEGPLLAVTAGMYIDRMRAAQMAERAPQQTVAQQVLAPQGGMPAAPSATPPQGLGAIAPEQMGAPSVPAASAPAPAPDASQSPMGMADGGYLPPYASGGLTDVPLPAGMFDEPSNGGFDDGYAGGGLVAFAVGGSTYDDFADVIPAQESGGNYRARNKSSGALGKYQLMPDTARAHAKRLGLPFRPELLTLDTPEARRYQDTLGAAAMKEAWEYGKGDPGLAALYYHGGPNQKGWGPHTKQYREDILSRLGHPKLEDQDVQTAEGRRRTLEDQYKSVNDLYADMPENKGVKRATDYYEKELDPKEQEKERKYDMWATLAQIGASMASSDSPYFLQGVGQAISAALPGAEASRRERKKVEREAINALTELYDIPRKEAKEKVGLAVDMQRAEIGAETSEIERKARKEESEAERTFRADQADLDRAMQKDIAKMQTEAKLDKGLEGLVARFEEKLDADRKAGRWKTASGGMPSDTDVRYWAYQQALAEWNKYKTTQQPSFINPADVRLPEGGSAGGQQQPVIVPWTN